MRYCLNRNTVDITAVGTKIDLIAPDNTAVNIGIDIPRNAMILVKIYTPEIIVFSEAFKNSAGFKKSTAVKPPHLAVVKAERKRKILIRRNGNYAFAS